MAEARATSRATANAATNHAAHAGLIWAIADLLRGDYKQSEYGRVILPLILVSGDLARIREDGAQLGARGVVGLDAGHGLIGRGRTR